MTEYISLRWHKDGDSYRKAGIYKGKCLSIRIGTVMVEISVTRKELE